FKYNYHATPLCYVNVCAQSCDPPRVPHGDAPEVASGLPVPVFHQDRAELPIKLQQT
ncbi:hypothetical protein BgiMline_027438, partial [Biomphalaria glabrata]